MVELGQALIGRRRVSLRTVFKSVGVAMQDWTIAGLQAERYL